MSATLRASEIPAMVDVDGHIDDNLLRWGQGCYVRAMAEVLEPRWEDENETDGWEFGRDAYGYWAADEWKPQPPKMLDAWERDLYGSTQPARSPFTFGGHWTVRFAVNASPWVNEMARAVQSMERLQWQFNETVDRAILGSWLPTFDSRTMLGIWNPPEPEPVTCPDLAPPSDTKWIADWALPPALTITADRFKLAPRPAAKFAETTAFWDRPRPRRTR